ncbi:MAG: bacteriohemerythrin [Spirochaetia bacterium]|nr:bacteriohemerythrin [Spirochaetia bacterium]MDD7699257.1 bacteriohemerythrin [Spirochaetia bacterium]
MAERVVWDDKYLLGIPEIDSQHKKLIEIANELYDIASVSTDKYKQEMGTVLKKIVDYTVYHFSNEEQFMQKYGYAGSAIHKTAHDSFVREVEYQVNKLSTDDVAAGSKFYEFISNWILTHIAKADKVWAAFVKTKLV